jgi:hypothetical protein
MGIFDELTKHSKHTSKRKITKNFLKTHGFYVDRWGGLEARKKPTSVFYEALVSSYDGIIKYNDKDHSVLATIKYFPEDFDGYTNFNTNRNKADQNGQGFGVVAGKLVITYEDEYWSDVAVGKGIYKDTMIFECKTHKDFYEAIDELNFDLRRKDYESIRF